MGAKMFQRAKDDPGVERFLDYFYRQCADVLFNPLFDLPDHKSHTGQYYSNALGSNLLNLYQMDA